MTNRQKNHTFLSTAGMWPRIPTTIGMVIKQVCTIFAPPPTFFDLISSLATRGYWKFVGKFPHCRKMLITWLIVPRKVTKLKTYNLPWDAYKHWEFCKNCANESLTRGKFMAKIRNFDSYGDCIPTFLPQWMWNLARVPVCPRAKFQISRLSGQCVAPARQKTHFWTTE